MKDENIVDLIKKTFELKELQSEQYLHGFLSGRALKFIIPNENVEKTVKEFPFLENAIKAGLIQKDKKKDNYFILEKTMQTKPSDRRNSGYPQFFSIKGDDIHERTTLLDGLITLNNIRYISDKFGVNSQNLDFTIRHENGDSDSVLNYINLDKNLFGNTEEEIEENIQRLNNFVKFERNLQVDNNGNV